MDGYGSRTISFVRSTSFEVLRVASLLLVTLEGYLVWFKPIRVIPVACLTPKTSLLSKLRIDYAVESLIRV